jgi:hypothetical protein
MLDIDTTPTYSSDRQTVDIEFKFTKVAWASTFAWDGEIYLRVNMLSNDPINSPAEEFVQWDYNEYYSYLPLRERKLNDAWEYYWIKWASFQPLYAWEGSWTSIAREKILRYDFVGYMWWANDPSMDVIGMVSWNEQVYMIGNMKGNGYIIPCDLSWGRGTPYIAYGCEFKWVVNIDYLLYLVWEDRGISQLWVYNWQEMVAILWWNEEKDSKNLTKREEQYRFDWKMVEYRDNLILSTEDGRIFEYWQTYGGKWWAFIHELPAWAVISNLKADSKDLVIDYKVESLRPTDPYTPWLYPPASEPFYVTIYSEDGATSLLPLWYWPTQRTTVWDIISTYGESLGFSYLSTSIWWNKLDTQTVINHETTLYVVSDTISANYQAIYQDDTAIKNYNTEWGAEYPIVIWNHLLEKEESDLYVSYILPSADTSLEFWGMANHYHFRTFTSSDNYTFSTAASYKMKGCTWNYELKFIEKNDNQYTFRLEWDLPIQTTNDMKITDSEWVELINYSDFHHFRKIGEITTTEYQEWEFRFHNLNNKLELPKSHSLQIMVKGKGTANYTPELFALDLVANQRDRW